MKVEVTQRITSAINSALAQVFNAGGGEVFLPSGIYTIDNGFDPVTNSILTIPQNHIYEGIPREIRLTGQARGSITGANNNEYIGGTLIDCRSVPGRSGVVPAIFAAAPFVQTSAFNESDWNHCNIIIDGITFLLPPSPDFTCINLANSMQGSIGDRVCIASEFINGQATQPTEGSSTRAVVGVWMPQVQNNVINNVGSCLIAGFAIGLIASDNCRLSDPYLVYNRRGMFLEQAYHTISGSVSFQFCWRLIEVLGGTSSIVNLDVKAECTDAAVWYSLDTGIYDAGNGLHGKMAYELLKDNVGYISMPIVGGTNLVIDRIR